MQMTRLEIYKRVCGRPLSKVAPELGITGTALAAICRKHQVPYPGSGYWTRKTLGLPVELVTLPEAPDEVIEIMPSVARSQAKRRVKEFPARKPKPVAKPPRPARHPLLVGVEEHYRKTRAIGRDEFLRPYKRILPDVISSDATLTRALSLANDLYVALGERGYRVEIARAESALQRIHVGEQEVERKDREQWHYSSSRICTPDRPTICYIGTVPIALAITEMTQRMTMRYLNGEYHREDSKLVRSTKPWQLTHSWTKQQDLPCGRFRLVAYSPKQGVDWSLNWQETEQQSLGPLIPQIIDALSASGDKLQRMMTDPLKVESPDDMLQALRDTQAALRLGRLVDRESRAVIRTALGGWRSIDNPNWRTELKVLDGILGRARVLMVAALRDGRLRRNGQFLDVIDLTAGREIEGARQLHQHPQRHPRRCKSVADLWSAP